MLTGTGQRALLVTSPMTLHHPYEFCALLCVLGLAQGDIWSMNMVEGIACQKQEGSSEQGPFYRQGNRTLRGTGTSER